MKVMHISPIVYLDRLITSFDLARTQAGMGHNVTVVGANMIDKSVREIAINDKLTVYLLPSMDFSHLPNISNKPYVIGLPNMIEEFEPDILHIQTHLNLTAIKAVLTARRFQIPAITTIHGVTAKVNPLVDMGQLAYLYTLGGIIFRNSHKVICLTEHDAFEVMKLGCPANRTIVIPNGVDIDLFKPREDPEDSLLVWHGRFVPQKGLEYLIKATALIVQRGYSKIEFALVGNGPLKPKMITLTKKLKLTKNIVFIGRLPLLKDVASFLSKASIYVLPSLREGMPWALLEAMACGKPVIGSNIPGINDIIVSGHNGVLVPPRNAKALANAVITLLTDEVLRRRLGQNARQLMVEKYNWNVITSKIEEVYHVAIEEANQSRSVAKRAPQREK